MPLWYLTRRSIANRALTVALTALCVALSVALLLGVERLRTDAREGFAQTLSGTDLVVGARGGAVQLLLYAVFHIGDATSDMSWRSVQAIAGHPQVEWLVPLSLGDSHRGFRVVGTTAAFFERYRYADGRPLRFASGAPFADVFDAVVGAEVAARLGYAAGDAIVVAHGAGDIGFARHDDKPFTVVGVLERTGTPVDRSVFVSLEGIGAIHLDWAGGARMPGLNIPAGQVRRFDLTPKTVTAALVGLKSRTAVFRVQRYVNAYADEPLTAVLPGVTLQQLWGVVVIAERALLAVSALVVLVGLAGLVAVVTASLGERRRELAILRALGAGPRHVFALLVLESLAIGLAGCVLGVLAVHGAALALGPWLMSEHGLLMTARAPSANEWMLLGGVLAATLAASVVPGVRAYRQSLADGMTIRV